MTGLWLLAGVLAATGAWPGPTTTPIAIAAVTAAVAATVRATTSRGISRRMWSLLAASQWSFAAGDLWWAVDSLRGVGTAAVSPADGAYLLGYPLLAAGLLSLVLARGGRAALPAAGDGLVVGVIATLGMWHYLVDELAAGSSAEWLIAAAYPVADVLLLACLAWVAAATGTRNTAVLFIAVNVGLTVGADLMYAADIARGGTGEGRLLDAAYVLAYLPLALAALHPSAGNVTWPRLVSTASAGGSRVLLLGAGVVAAPLVGVMAALEGHSAAFLVVMALVCGVIVARIAGIVNEANRDRAALTEKEELLAHRAMHDDLTELPNRRALLEDLAARLGRSRRDSVVVVVAELDDFNLINDGLGHATGDELLRRVAERLRDVAGDGELVARIGGDEFVLVTSTPDGSADALAAARRVAVALEAPFALTSGEVYVGASLGVVVADGDEERPAQELLQDAGIALYRAREGGRGQCQVFGGAMRQWVSERRSLENDLRRAIDHDEITLAYQPQVDLGSRLITGVEALARWQHPTRGHVSPAQFVPLAESTGLIVPLGERLLARACADARRWSDTFGPVLTVSVNVSARQLAQPDVVERMRAVIGAAGVPTGVMVLELTETALATDPARMRQRMAALRDLGLRIELDDFGTGQSSLAALRTFPLDAVKIDRGFMEGVGEDTRATHAVAAVVALIHALGLGSVAEGIETEDQARAMSALGCGRGQGYLFGRPSPAVVIDALLAEGGRLPVLPAAAPRAA
ncbi:MAG: bifunctional diguanylate cyclase/phosphodiesterase [Thermoleophilia bacterium]